MDNHTENIYRRLSKRLGDLSLFFLLWAFGWLLLILASIGATQVSLTLSSIGWQVALIFLMLLGCVVWNIAIPLYYVFTSIVILVVFFIESIESYLVKKFPLDFTNKPLFEGIEYDIFERYL